LADSDAKLVSDVVRISDGVKTKRARLREAMNDAEETARQLEEQRALLQATREERHLALTRIADERALAFRAENELVMRHAELAALVNRLAGESTPTRSRRGRGILTGGLPWPVDGAVIRRFGVTIEQDTRAEIMSNGMEIRADAGAPVTTVADGRVVHSGWLRGFGIIVIVDHGEGHHTLSAHLQKALVQRGDEVVRGQGVGLVGDTESNNGSKLYFELRERSRPKDPAPFLIRR
jgi:septal ring factor EnvC (AmiA/AmiB activator)